MKNLVLLFTALIFGISGTKAATAENKVVASNTYGYNDSFIFVEDGITFSVFPDGEFDFYIDNRANFGASINTRNVSVTFNSGYNYNPYVQYDDYGAILQVENVPIYYDYYGRVTQIGNVDINYINGRVSRLGGMHVFYNNRGYYSHYAGFINVYNRNYVYRPFHRYFVRPSLGLCLVYNRPYRRYYNPVRYTYYAPYRNNVRRAYAKVGRTYRYNADRRGTIYRNDNRVTTRSNARANRPVTRKNYNDNTYRGDRGNSRKTVTRTTTRTNPNTDRTVKRTTTVNRNDNNKRVVSRTTRTNPNKNVVSRTTTKRQVSTSPNTRTVKRTTTYRKPSNTSSRKTVATKRVDRSVKSSNRSSGNSNRKSTSRSTRSTRSVRN